MKYLIYLVTNLIDGKQYIGQTQDGRLARRIKEHLHDAADESKNVAFHNALNKYGIDNFKVEIIEEDILVEQIDKRETYWIAYYNTYIHAENSNGYNETLGGQGTHGYIFTEEDRCKISNSSKIMWENLRADPQKLAARNKKLSESQKGKPKSAEHKQKISIAKQGSIPWNKGTSGLQEAWNKGYSDLPKICQYDLITGNLLNTFTNAAAAVENLKLTSNISTGAGRILLVCKTNRGHAYGYIWRFETDELIQILSADIIALENRPAKAKPIVQYDIQGLKIAEYESAMDFARTVAKDYNKQRNIAKAINYACKNNTIYKNYIWKYK